MIFSTIFPTTKRVRKVTLHSVLVLSLLSTLVGVTPAVAEDDLLLTNDSLDQNDELLLTEDSLLSDDDDLLTESDELLSEDDDLLLEDDDSLSNEQDLLTDDQSESLIADSPETFDAAAEAHLGLFAEERYPSANTCKVCHPRQYEQWSVSQHAYAQLSPVYMAMQNTINAVTSNTNGDFCIRCHNQVGMNMGESTYASNLERHPTSREGITCVVCHRMNKEYGKVSGRIALEEGGILAPIYGPKGNEELQRVIENRDQYKVVTEEDEAGRKIHTKIGHFPYLSSSAFCGTCHDVNLFNGFRLEEAFSEYKNAPAAQRGDSCQDCHMGKIQGVVSGYEHGPAAMVGDEPTTPRKLTNHFFAGPDYSVVHPGIFPHNADAAAMATMEEWLAFDHKAGWGTDDFENNVSEDYEFPERWDSIDDRYDAREILNHQIYRLKWAENKRLEVLRNGYLLGEITPETAKLDQGLSFSIEVKNGTDGHNVPTGFDAERLIWLDVTVTDPNNKVIFRSGDLDPNGDLRDTHSLYVHNDEVPLDDQLFTLQSRFITSNIRGGEREQVLAVNFSNDPLPFIRPFTRSLMLTGQPDSARKHRQTIPPKATRLATYDLDEELLDVAGDYKVTVMLKSAAVPVNLIDAIKGVGFDYNMSAKEVAENVVENHQVIWEKQAAFEIR